MSCRPAALLPAALALFGSLYATAPVAAGQAPLPLSLEQAIDAALQHNPGVLAAGLDRRIRESAVEVEASRFGRVARADVAHRAERAPSISSLENVSTTTTGQVTAAAAVEQRLASGGSVDMQLRAARLSSNAAYFLIDPVYESELSVGITQPLLRGRGEVNEADRRIAGIDLDVAHLEEARQRRDLRAQVAGAYWDLHYALEVRALQRQLVAGAARVLETARERAAAGAGPRAEILQAEVGVARRNEEVVAADGRVRQFEDALKALTGLDRDPGTWDRRLSLTSVPQRLTDGIDLRAGVDSARQQDADLRRAELRVAALDLRVDQARDRARPQVDLTARLGVSGIGADLSDNGEALARADGRSWLGRVQLDIPLGDDPEARRLQQWRLERERGQLDVERRRLELVQQVRQQYRAVEISAERTAVAALAVDLARQNLAEAEQRQALGLATVREVLDAQDDLASARTRRLEAQVELRKARLEWDRLTGRV